MIAYNSLLFLSSIFELSYQCSFREAPPDFDSGNTLAGSVGLAEGPCPGAELPPGLLRILANMQKIKTITKMQYLNLFFNQI